MDPILQLDLVMSVSTLHVAFENHEHLRQALLWDLQPPGLCIPAQDSLVVGEAVSLELDVRGSGSIVLAGTVIWRQVRGVAGARPGVGIRFAPHQDAWLAFVEPRAHPPSLHRLPISFVVQGDETLREGQLMDLSAWGARLSAHAPPASGLVLALRLRPPLVSPIVAARVLRREGADAWIELVSERPAVLEFWTALVLAQEET